MAIEFGTDGWRAVISDEFTFANVRHVAQAIADSDSHYRAKGLVIGFDTRFLSDRYAAEMARVLAANDIPVSLSEADAATPVISYAIKDRKAAGGIMITASHNPPRYNGVKLKTDTGGAVTRETARQVEKVLNANLAAGKEPLVIDYQDGLADGVITRFDPLPAYARHLATLVNLDIIRSMDVGIVVDSMYGAGRGVIAHILGPRGRYRLREIRGDMNPGFGGIHPEPIAKHLGALLLEIRQSRWDVGLATDGDADRIGAMTADGTFVDPHWIFALSLRYLVEKRGWRGDVVKTVSTTQMVDKLCAKYGLKLHETPVGFNHICDLMMKNDVLIGGEESGGISIKGHVPEGDGILMGLLLLEIMAESGRSLGDNLHLLAREVGQHHYERRDLPVKAGYTKAVLLKKLRETAPDEVAGVKLSSVGELDGVKYRFADGSWLLMRPSGTEPVVRVYAEALNPEQVQALLEVGEAACR
jgi:alpha-D-glucose phosphate-specific phosphoglucomutase